MSTTSSLIITFISPGVCHSESRPLRMYNTAGGGWLNIFPDLTFGCSGNIHRHEFYAYSTGRVHIGAWRNVGSNTFELIGVNVIDVTNTGAQVNWFNSCLCALPGY